MLALRPSACNRCGSAPAASGTGRFVVHGTGIELHLLSTYRSFADVANIGFGQLVSEPEVEAALARLDGRVPLPELLDQLAVDGVERHTPFPQPQIHSTASDPAGRIRYEITTLASGYNPRMSGCRRLQIC